MEVAESQVFFDSERQYQHRLPLVADRSGQPASSQNETGWNGERRTQEGMPIQAGPTAPMSAQQVREFGAVSSERVVSVALGGVDP